MKIISIRGVHSIYSGIETLQIIGDAVMILQDLHFEESTTGHRKKLSRLTWLNATLLLSISRPLGFVACAVGDVAVADGPFHV